MMTPDEMRRAAHILDAEAESLRRCNTDASGEWVLYYEGQADREAHDEIRALAAKLRAMADAPSGWQPIETAPRDGTCVLLCWAQNADGKPIDWTRDPKTAGVFVQAASWWQGDGWVVYCSMIQDPSLHFNPTHWRPLPPPPEAK